jgi:hypothetical protein
MADTEQNGYKNPRMDRLENLMEMVIADHVKFADEHNKLLTAQVVLTDRMDKLTIRMDKLTGTMEHLVESQRVTDARLNILIQVMDNLIRERGDKK